MQRKLLVFIKRFQQINEDKRKFGGPAICTASLKSINKNHNHNEA